MTHPRPRLATLLPELYTHERRTTAPPTTEELLAYLAGELDPAAAAALQERLALSPEATRRLLALADPPALATPPPADLPTLDVEALRARLRGEGLLGPAAEPQPAKVLPFRSTERRGVHPLYRWATAALVVLCTGLALRLGQLPAPTPGIALDVAVWELLPRSVESRRGEGQLVEAREGFSNTLLLYSDAIAAGAEVRVEIVSSTGEVALAAVVKAHAVGRVGLRLERETLAAGSFEIRLFALGQTVPLAVYPLEWRRP